MTDDEVKQIREVADILGRMVYLGCTLSDRGMYGPYLDLSERRAVNQAIVQAEKIPVEITKDWEYFNNYLARLKEIQAKQIGK